MITPKIVWIDAASCPKLLEDVLNPLARGLVEGGSAEFQPSQAAPTEHLSCQTAEWIPIGFGKSDAMQASLTVQLGAFGSSRQAPLSQAELPL